MGKRLRKPLKKEKTYSEKIVKILSQNTNKVYNYKQIAENLNILSEPNVGAELPVEKKSPIILGEIQFGNWENNYG